MLFAVLLFLVPSVPGWSGDPERHSLAVVSIPVSVVLLLVYAGVTRHSLRRHKRLHEESGHEALGGWSLSVSLAVLGAATLVTALISETLVHSLDVVRPRGRALRVLHLGRDRRDRRQRGRARRRDRHRAPREACKLATEIAVSSSAQVALLVTPVVALLSWLVRPALPLSFRPIELAAMGGAAALVALVIGDGRGRRWEGYLLVAVYAGVALGFLAAGDR